MCDDRTEAESVEHLGHRKLTRRQFGAVTAGAGLVWLWPRVANARALTEREVDIETPDGVADCFFVTPDAGAHPGVIIWPDAFGLRPAMRQMARRLSESGYSVLVVNPYYRVRRAPVVSSTNFAEVRETLMPLMGGLGSETQRRDAVAMAGWLDRQSSVDQGRGMGTMGYCMGGPFTMRTAAALPDRVRAAASFHGGGLVTQAADSPHLLVPTMRVSYLIAIAENDDRNQPEAKNTLRDAFEQAGLQAEIEVYAGAMHGWCPPDSTVYDEERAERAWSRLLVLFGNALA